MARKPNMDVMVSLRKGKGFLEVSKEELIQIRSSLMVCSLWLSCQALLQVVLPGRIVKGRPIPYAKTKNFQLTYVLNGWLSAIVSLSMVIGGHLVNWWALTHLANHLIEYAVSSMIISYILSIFMYMSSRIHHAHRILAPGGSTGNVIYDFFMGNELNPRWGALDWKYMCELRPGLIGWLLINLSMIVKHYEKVGSVSMPLLLVVLFQGIYVLDALWHEEAILSTMDITRDGFGFMLIFGDLCWVPFTYSLQARYLAHHAEIAESLPISTITLSIVLFVMGYWVFRGSNSQKHDFRSNPDDPKMKALRIIHCHSNGKPRRLLVDGWWKLSRHINYAGDLMMAWSWCLLCGTEHVWPYFYVVYFTILLLHRERRDHTKCLKQYGNDWMEYCHLVPYRIIPGLY